MTTSSPGRRNELGPMALDGVLKGNTSGPFYSMASNYDVSCPCPCISDEEDLKRQCDKHKSKTENLIDKIEYKVAELERLKAYTDRFGKILDRIRIEDIETLIRYTESEDEMETDLGTRQYFHCNKEECVHRSSFDLYLRYKTAKWELKFYCSLVDREHHSLQIWTISVLHKLRPEKKSFDWHSLTDEKRILDGFKVPLQKYLVEHGITSADDLEYCKSDDLHFIAKCLKDIPRRAFCDRHRIRFES